MAVGETVVLQPGPEKGIDTYISSSSIGDNGSAVLMLASSNSAGNRAFSLLKFVLPELLYTKHIISARLELYAMFVYAGSDSAVTVNVHRMLEPWEESWVWSDFESLENYPMSQDLFDENIEDSEFATAGVLMSFYLTDLVRDWISGFSSNYGVLLETPYFYQDRAVGMPTSNWPLISEHHPKLIIDYTETPIPTIDFHPETLNLKSSGKWVTCYIELPDGHDVEDIDISTIAIMSIAVNGEEAEVGDCDGNEILAEDHPTEVGDYDGDGIPDLMVKFDRGCVQAAASAGEAVITLEFQMIDDEMSFKGTDTLLVIDKGK